MSRTLYARILLCGFASAAGLGHAALTTDVPPAQPSRGWCIVYAEGEMIDPDLGFAAQCDARPEWTS